MSDIRVGISGWTYPPWRKTFYPVGLPQKRELAHAANLLHTIEINGSFYALQKPASYRKWFAETPDDFMFSVKGGRFITHMKKLRGVETALANFFASGVLALEHKLGPLLWQLPPVLAFEPDRLTAFFELLPRTTVEAARLAARHRPGRRRYRGQMAVPGRGHRGPGVRAPARRRRALRQRILRFRAGRLGRQGAGVGGTGP